MKSTTKLKALLVEGQAITKEMQAMNTQATNEVTLSFVESFESYVTDSKAMGELKTRLEDARKILEPVIKAHKIPVEPKAENNRLWKEKRAVFLPLLEELETRAVDHAMDDEEKALYLKRKDARVIAWLGVIRTCLELQILPTDKNADRLRKARMWTGLNGNGKLNPNWVDPKAPKVEPVIAETTSVQTVAASPTPEATKSEPQTTPKVPSASAVTPQKTETKVHPLTSNVSSSDEPLSAREHFGVLFTQLLKNETFRGEYCDILAMMLEVDKATLTRCMVQARDEIK